MAKSRGDDAEDRSQDLLREGERAVRRWLHARRILGERDESLVATATAATAICHSLQTAFRRSIK